MDLPPFALGVALGLAVAAPVGPMSLLCMRRTLAGGFCAGLLSGLGVATADALYGAVAAFGLVAIAGFLVGLGGGLMLGRVDADILSIAAPELRGRVFSVKAMAFTLALVGVMGPLSASDDGRSQWKRVGTGRTPAPISSSTRRS